MTKIDRIIRLKYLYEKSMLHNQQLPIEEAADFQALQKEFEGTDIFMVVIQKFRELQKEYSLMSAKLAAIEKYSKPHIDIMWGGTIYGICRGTDFRGEKLGD